MQESSNYHRMGFSRESSYKLMKGVAPSLSMRKKNGTISRTNDQLCRSRSMGHTGDVRGSVHKNRKKAAAVFPESEDVGAEDRLGSARLADESDCMWLTSDCKSPSFSFDDQISWDVCELESNNLSLDRLCSLLPSKSSELSLNNGTHFFDGSNVSPMEETSLVLERTSDGVETVGHEDSKEKQVVGWLSSAANCLKDSSVSLSESIDSHHESSLFEDSTVSSVAWTSLSTLNEASSLVREVDQAGVQVSLLDLDREDSEWISDKDLGFDVLQSDFPSPSYKINWNSEVGFSQCNSFPSIDQKHEEFSHASPSMGVSEAANQANVNTDEPLFWPFQLKFEWNTEIAWDFFCISPRKSGRKIEPCERSHTPRSTGIRVNERKMNLKEGCKRSLVFNSGSKVSTSMECKSTDGKKGIKRSSTMPARLSRSFRDSMRKTPSNMKDKMEEPVRDKAQAELLMEDFKFLDDVFTSNDDIPIETLIGLNEFDGHEGVDQEFNKDQFLLDE